MKQRLFSSVATAIILLLLLIQNNTLNAQQNPFLSAPPAQTEKAGEKGTEGIDIKKTKKLSVNTGPFFNSAPMMKIKAFQKSFQAEISDILTDFTRTGNRDRFPSFLLFSYLYGLLHVLGPGHRKIFLFTYFVSRPSKWRQGMLAGIATALLHALSAIVFIGGLYLITTKTLMTRFNNITPIIELIGYLSIILIGVFTIFHHIFTILKKRDHSHSRSGRNPDTILFVLASGLIPCPGAATIMIFSLALGVPAAGIYAVAAMSLGMATVLAFVPPAAIVIRDRMDPLISRWNPGVGDRIHTAVSVAGASVLILFGLLFIV